MDPLPKDDFTRDDAQRRFLAQHRAAMLEQCCNRSKQCRNNVATLCCAKGRCCESSRVTSPSNAQYVQTLRFSFRCEDLRNWLLKSYSDPDKYLSFSIGGKEKWLFFFSWFVKTLSVNTFVFSSQIAWSRGSFSSP